MHEVQAVERMALVLNAPIHVRAAALASVALDHGRRIDDRQLVAVFEDRKVVAGNDSDHREHRSLRFPALGAAAGMIVGDIALDADLDRPILAFADECAAGKAAGALLHSTINRWVDMSSHRPILLMFDVSD